MVLQLMESRSKLTTSITSTRVVPLLWVLWTLVCLPVTAANWEATVLQRFKNTLSDPLGALRSWDPDTENPCTWSHIECNDETEVVNIYLGSSRLTGVLIPALALMRSLQKLELQNNHFWGSIPEEFGNLTELTYLNLSGNDLDGTIPDSLGYLNQLKILALNNNNLSGPIPMSLSTLEGLYNLQLSNNDLSGRVPENGSFAFFRNESFAGNPQLCGLPLTNKLCPGDPPVSSPSRSLVMNSSSWTVQVWSVGQMIIYIFTSCLISVTLYSS